MLRTLKLIIVLSLIALFCVACTNHGNESESKESTSRTTLEKTKEGKIYIKEYEDGCFEFFEKSDTPGESDKPISSEFCSPFPQTKPSI